jgi:exosortase
MLQQISSAHVHPLHLPRQREHAVWACLFAICAVFAPTVHWLWQRWTLSIWHNGHGLFIPFIVAYLVGQTLRNETENREESSRWGFAFLLPALLLICADSAIRTQLLSAFALVLCLPGLSLLFLGARRTRALAFPLVLPLFMLPVPAAFISGLHYKLRIISGIGAERLLSLVNVAVERNDTTLHIADGLLVIADACSGFSALYACVTLAMLLAHKAESARRAIVILLAAVPVAIGCNIVRCFILAMLSVQYGREILATEWHVISGFVSFAASIGLLALVANSRWPVRSETT